MPIGSVYQGCNDSKVKLNDRNQIQLFTMDELFKLPDESNEWILDGILGEGETSLLAAKPKCGKTTFIRCLMLSISRGEQFIERKTKKGKVIGLLLEDKRAEIKNHFKAMGAKNDEDILITFNINRLDSIKWLKSIIEKYTPKLVVIDTLCKFKKITDLNDYSVVLYALDEIVNIARATGTHILMSHHIGKRGDGTDSILGSTALFGSVDTVIMLNRIGSSRTIKTIQRYGSDMQEFDLLLDGKTRKLSLGYSRSESHIDRVEDQIVNCLLDSECSLSEAEIYKRIKGKSVYKGAALRNLLTKGRLEKSGKGVRGAAYRYTLSNSTS